jgi:hypothetical protein
VNPYFENAINFSENIEINKKRGRTLLYQDGVGNRAYVKEKPMPQRN